MHIHNSKKKISKRSVGFEELDPDEHDDKVSRDHEPIETLRVPINDFQRRMHVADHKKHE